MAVLLRDSASANLPSRTSSSRDADLETRGLRSRQADARIGGMTSVLKGSFQVSAPRDVALIYMCEHLDDEVRSWIGKACAESDLTEIPSCMTLEASNLAAPFDVRLVLGEGVRQLVGWLVKSGEYQEWRPSIAMISSSTPRQRAYLLRCGFDDVFDLSELEPLEGLMRIAAIWSGYSRYRSAAEIERRLERELVRMSSDGSWTNQQRQFLTLLLTSPGGFVRYDDLGAKISEESSIVPRHYLKVVASHIRKKLTNGYCLSAISQRGYLLSMDGERLDFLQN